MSMTELLCKIFIKDRMNIKNPSVRRAYGTLASIVGIILNMTIAVGKIIIGFLFGAISLEADGINNLSDAGAQIISFISFKIAAKPADKDHPFGHARIEYVASMIVSFFVLLIGWNLLTSSVEKIFNPDAVTKKPSIVVIIVLAISIIVKLWLCVFNRRLAKKIDSTVMKATSADSLSDAIATFAVLVSMLVYRFTGFDTDGIMGAIVAIVILIAGIKILNETKNSILGEKADPEIVANIKEIVSEFPDALGIHDMVVHNYGPGITIVSLHIEVDGEQNIFHTHDMIDNIEKALNSRLNIHATIHMDPIVTNDAEVTEMLHFTRSHVKEIDEQIDIHDFRFVRGNTHTNLIFDVSVPFDIKYTDGQIKDLIQFKISEHDKNLMCVITVDRC